MLLAAGPARLAQAATPDDRPVVSADLLRAAIAGEDMDAYALDDDMLSALAEAVTRIEGAIARAESDLDAACRGRYALPLSPIDAAALGILRDLAISYVYTSVLPLEVEAAANAARSSLLRIARGDLVLSAAAMSSASQGEPLWSSESSPWDMTGVDW